MQVLWRSTARNRDQETTPFDPLAGIELDGNATRSWVDSVPIERYVWLGTAQYVIE